MPKSSDAGDRIADARRYTAPVTLMVWSASAVVPRPLVPLPLEVNATWTVPVLAPAAAVLAAPRPTVMLELLALPGARRLIDPPLSLAPLVSEPKAASSFSLNPSLAAVLLIDS